MIIKTIDGSFHIRAENISSVSMAEEKNWDTKKPEYIVFISNGTGIASVYKSSVKENAQEVVNDIGHAIDDVLPEKTYLDGFKDGTEYAIKLIKEK